MTPTADESISRFNTLEGQRETLISHCRDISRLVLPSHDVFWQGKPSTTQGERRNQQVFDATAQMALSRFASAIDSMMTPSTQKWHSLRASDPDLMRDRDVKLWFDQVNDRLFAKRYEAGSGFQGASAQTYLSIGAFGTGSTFVDENPEQLGSLRYSRTFMGDLVIDVNHQGIVDTAFRRFWLTNRQARQKFGDNTPQEIQKQIKDMPDQDREFLHFVGPNPDHDPDSIDDGKLKFLSIYIDVQSRENITIGGYRTFPYPTARYEMDPYSAYGRSPAMQVLPWIRTINEMARVDLRASHLAIQPPILAYDDGITSTFDMRPGHVTYGGVDERGNQLIRPFNSGVQPQLSEEKMARQASAINDAFLVSLFQILAEAPQMTATEVMARMQEKGALIAPVLGRVQSEYSGTLIEREVDILIGSHQVPPLPDALIEAGDDYQISYENPISRLQRSEELVGATRLWETTKDMAAAGDQAAMIRFDSERFQRLQQEIGGAPVGMLRDEESVQAELQQIQEQQAQERQAAINEQQSQAVGNMAGAEASLAQAEGVTQ